MLYDMLKYNCRRVFLKFIQNDLKLPKAYSVLLWP